jgi:hypothetical protein
VHERHRVPRNALVRMQMRTSPGLPCIPPARLDIARVGHAAGLASLPNCVVALTAVPGVGARPFSTRPSLPGAQPTGCGSIPPAKAAHKERQFEINTAGRMCDRRNWDIAVKYGCCRSAQRRPRLERILGPRSGHLAPQACDAPPRFPAGGLIARRLPDHELCPAQFLDIRKDTKPGRRGHVVATIGMNERAIVLLVNSGEVGVADGQLDEIPVRVATSRPAWADDSDTAMWWRWFRTRRESRRAARRP